MNGPDTTLPATPAQDLATGFAQHLERWSLARGADAAPAAAAGEAARALSTATSDGHVCIALGELPALPGGPAGAASWRQALLASGVVGTAETPGSMPMIVDGGDRLYLHRYFDYERRLARRLMQARGAATRPADVSLLRERLQAFIGSETSGAADWQQLAAALALRGRLTIVSGGPGTGKTTTVVNLLACLLELDPDCRIALAAPTGKAAARLSEAVRQRAAHLPDSLRRRLPTESYTVHRLLGVTPAPGGFVHHAGHPLAIDALVVDEASMLALALATRLLEAVPPTARIVWLGDKDQLSAVEAGAVFSALSVDPSLSPGCVDDLAALTGTPASAIRPPAAVAPSALVDSVVWFTRNFRFARDSGIGRLAALVNEGQATPGLDWLRDGSDSAVQWIDDGAAGPSAPTMQRMVDGYAPYAEALRRADPDLGAIAAAYGRFRVLCALREGPRGVVALNAELTRRLRPDPDPGAGDEASAWFPGRPVTVLRNDPVLRLYNGDIGITLADAGGTPWVHFATPDGGWRAMAPARLPPHETAFAMTVHKAQGSEFDAVLVLLPQQRSRVLTRELLYTAVTRARSGVTLCGGAAVIAAAIATPTRRNSGLLARLDECAEAASLDGDAAGPDQTPSSSTSKTSVAFGGITPPAPRAP